MSNSTSKAGLIWNIAELLRGSWKQYEYQDVVLPLVVLKRLDSILVDSKPRVLEQYNQFKGKVDVDPVLKSVTKTGFYNISQYDLKKLLEDPKHIAKNLRNYILGFSENIQEIIAKFDFEKQIDRLEGGNLLFLVLKELDKVDLHPKTTDNHDMGYIFEELIRKFAEQSNETAGEHYTPREVIEMMVEVLFSPDKELLKKKHIIKTVYDCACGTGGMLSTSKEHILKTINPDADIYLFGQELNPATYAICKSDMLIKGDDPDRIKGGDKDHSKASTLSNDEFLSDHFDYALTNPPFGVDWKKDKEAVSREAERGFAGRFGAGLPRISDGQFLFLQHLISKMRNVTEGGSRIAIVFNGSPLFTGDAGSGESEIRRWILEHDWLETIVALPDQLFYNTGINTYVWFLSNRKVKERKNKVQLIDARNFFKKMRKSLGNKRNEISDEDRSHILKLYESNKNSEYSKIFNTTDFAYRKIVIERPLRLVLNITEELLAVTKPNSNEGIVSAVRKGRLFGIKGDFKSERSYFILEKMLGKKFINQADFVDSFKKVGLQEKFFVAYEKEELKNIQEVAFFLFKNFGERNEQGDIFIGKDGQPEADSELRDSENVPYHQDVKEYFEKEVKPFVPDAWIDETVVDVKDGKVGKVGYEIPLTRYFYKYQPPRALSEIESDIEEVENELLELLKKL